MFIKVQVEAMGKRVPVRMVGFGRREIRGSRTKCDLKFRAETMGVSKQKERISRIRDCKED